MPSLIEYAAEITPSPRQLAWQELEFYAFIHFGMNTFTDREWGDGSEDPSWFNPEGLDARQWTEAVKSAGMKGLILTCKHHDGFCLWPSRYTDHSVKASPWRQGRGDVVREAAQACREAGLRFGVYLSPWDRHEPSYGTGNPYDDFFVHQLTELATGYGEIFCFWFDGACGEGKNGRKQRYDWERYYQVIRRYQPGAVISVCGPDVRWCGNEAGHCRRSEWSVVPAELRDTERIASLSQREDDPAFARRISSHEEDLGSRDAIASASELVWYPAEVNTSIRPGWFYHSKEDTQVRSHEELFHIYLNSVGANAAFLLNLPPDPRGLLPEPDVQTLGRLGQRLRADFHGAPIPPCALHADSQHPEHPAENLLTAEKATYWQAGAGKSSAELTLSFSQGALIRYVVLEEALTVGQRIEEGEILVDGRKISGFTVVGHKRICSVHTDVREKLTVRILQARREPALRRLLLL